MKTKLNKKHSNYERRVLGLLLNMKKLCNIESLNDVNRGFINPFILPEMKQASRALMIFTKIIIHKWYQAGEGEFMN